jgi:hypothetical protein
MSYIQHCKDFSYNLYDIGTSHTEYHLEFVSDWQTKGVKNLLNYMAPNLNFIILLKIDTKTYKTYPIFNITISIARKFKLS